MQKFPTQIEDVSNPNLIKTCEIEVIMRGGRGSAGSVSSAQRYSQPKQTNFQPLNTGSKSPNQTSKGRKSLQKNAASQIPNLMARQAIENQLVLNWEQANLSIMNITDLQDSGINQNSMFINNLNNSTFSNADYKEMAMLSAEMEKKSHHQRKVSGEVSKMPDRRDFMTLFNQNQIADQQDNALLEQTQQKLKSKVNISQISPHKLGEFFQNSNLYAKSSKHNSISLSYIIDETDPRFIFEQPKTNKHAAHKKGLASKSPNSNSRMGKSNKGGKGRKSSRQDSRIQRKSVANANNTIKKTQRNASNEIAEVNSQTKTKKQARKSQPLTATNNGGIQTIANFIREVSEERHSTQNQKGEAGQRANKSAQRQKSAKQPRIYDSIQRPKSVNYYDSKFKRSGQPKRLSLDIAAAEAMYQEKQLSLTQTHQNQHLRQLSNVQGETASEQDSQNQIQNLLNQKMAEKQQSTMNSKKPKVQYIFNGKQELRLQEQNLTNIGASLKSRQGNTRPGGKLAALNSKYEELDIKNVHINKINSDNNLLHHSNNHDSLKQIDTDFEVKRVVRKDGVGLQKLRLVNGGKVSSMSLQDFHAHQNQKNSRFDSGAKNGESNERHYSAYDQPTQNSKVPKTIKVLNSMSQERKQGALTTSFGTAIKQSDPNHMHQAYSNFQLVQQQGKEIKVCKQLYVNAATNSAIKMKIKTAGRLSQQRDRSAQEYDASGIEFEESQPSQDQVRNQSVKTDWRNSHQQIFGKQIQKKSQRVSARSLQNCQPRSNSKQERRPQQPKQMTVNQDIQTKIDIAKLIKQRQSHTLTKKMNVRNNSNRQTFSNLWPESSTVPPHSSSQVEWRARSAMRNDSLKRRNQDNSLVEIGQETKKVDLSMFKPLTNNFVSINEHSPIKLQRKNLQSATENQTSMQKPTKGASGLSTKKSPFEYNGYIFKKIGTESSITSFNRAEQKTGKPVNSQQIYFDGEEGLFGAEKQHHSVNSHKVVKVIGRAQNFKDASSSSTFILKLNNQSTSGGGQRQGQQAEKLVRNQAIVSKSKGGKPTKILKITKSNFEKDPLLNKLEESSDAPKALLTETHAGVYRDAISGKSSTQRPSLGMSSIQKYKKMTEPNSADDAEERLSLKFENESNQEKLINQQQINQNNMDRPKNIHMHTFSNQEGPFALAKEAVTHFTNPDTKHRAQTALETHIGGLKVTVSNQKYKNTQNNHIINSNNVNDLQHHFGPKPSLLDGQPSGSNSSMQRSPIKQRKLVSGMQNTRQDTGVLTQDTGTFNQREAINQAVLQKFSQSKPIQSKVREVNQAEAIKQKSLKSYQNFISNNIVEAEMNANYSGSNEGVQFLSQSQKPKVTQKILQMSSTKPQPQSINSRLKINHMVPNSRGGAQTAQKVLSQHSKHDVGLVNRTIIPDNRSQLSNNDSKIRTATTQNQKTVMNALKAFGLNSSPGKAASINSDSRNQALSVSSKSQPMRLANKSQISVFQHQVTVPDVHRNTVTDICLLPPSMLEQKSQQQIKKLFTSSTDSTVKFWQFFETSDSSNRSVESTHAAPMTQSPEHSVVKTNMFGTTEQPKSYFNYEFNEIQQNGRKRVKVNSMVFMPDLNLLATGGTDRFISLYNDQQGNGRFKCVQKILKQSANTVINSMCAIDGDKLLVGQTDEYIRLYQIPSYGFNQDENDIAAALENPITMYKFEDSGINNLCSLNDKNMFISSGFNRSISVWDTRQTQPILFFKDIHYDKISAIDKFNTEIFASASEDGFVNLWDLRMGEFIKQLKVDQNERISSIKFVNSSLPSGYESYSTPRKGDFISANRHLLIAHADKISILSAKDNFTKRHTFCIGEGLGSEDKLRINQMKFSEEDQALYLSLHSSNPRNQRNLLSVWNLNLNVI